MRAFKIHDIVRIDGYGDLTWEIIDVDEEIATVELTTGSGQPRKVRLGKCHHWSKETIYDDPEDDAHDPYWLEEEW